MKTTRHNPQLSDTDAEGTPRRINLTPTTPNTEMTKDELKNRVAVEQAYLNGEEIEMVLLSHLNDAYPDWTACKNVPLFDWTHFMYRVKPTPKYIPFDSPDKVLDAIKEHGSFVKPIKSTITCYTTIAGITPQSIHVYDYGMATHFIHTYKEFLERYEFADGTPCGTLVDAVDTLKAD